MVTVEPFLLSDPGVRGGAVPVIDLLSVLGHDDAYSHTFIPLGVLKHQKPYECTCRAL